MTRIVLTQPQGLLGVPGATLAGIVVPSVDDAPANIVVLDTAENQTVKWIYTLTDLTDVKTISAEVSAVRRSAVNISFNRFGIIGDILQHTIDVKSAGSALSLEITNLHSNDLLASVLRIQAA